MSTIWAQLHFAKFVSKNTLLDALIPIKQKLFLGEASISSYGHQKLPQQQAENFALALKKRLWHFKPQPQVQQVCRQIAEITERR